MTNVVILDGGMGQELVRRGLAEGPLWSTRALFETPAAVTEVHDAYVAAGAEVLTTNTYAISRHRFDAAGATVSLAEAVRTACRLAAESVADRPVRIAGSLGPLFGSYAPERVPSEEAVHEEYDEVVEAMADTVDLVLAETLTTVREAHAAAAAAAAHGLPVWISWTVQTSESPDRLPDGTPIREAVQAVGAEVHLLNCSPPERMDQAVVHLAEATDTFGIYANGFAEVPAGWSLIDGDPLPAARRDLDPDTYLEHARRWVDAGATVVGGCCEVGPAHIRLLAEEFGGRGGPLS